jgi:alpha-galactosidase
LEADVARRPPPLATKLPANAVWVESLDLTTIDQGWGKAQAGLSVEGAPLTIGNQAYAHGVGTHAHSEMMIGLQGEARRFEAVVGVDDETGDVGSVVFVVYLDDQEAWRSPTLTGADGGVPVSIVLDGADRMTLVVESAGDGIHYDHADWAGAMIVLQPGAGRLPTAVIPPMAPVPEIVTHRPLKPAINAPYIAGTTPGLPFLFRVPTSGERPIRFTATNLPTGLELDPETGIITGSLAGEGTFDVGISAENAHGRDASTLTIVGGTHQLALTPPMGWNSWNVWGTSVDDAKVRAAADRMVASGLADHGYQYINIDDAWEGERDADGRIQSNEKFPDMRALADYVHAKGLKLGIYSSPGPKTCAGYEGSYQHERLDAETFAAWGIDLIKYDWCSYGKIAADDSRAALRKPYEVMREALDDCGRDIVYSLCQYGMGQVSEWGADVGGNYWRTTGDIFDDWGSMSGIGFGQAGLEAFAGPGHWNDPDMLVVGMVGWGPDLHRTRLTRQEQVTHITLWSLLASPLLIGCDLSQLDDFTLALLTNPEVLAVNQDPLGRQAARIDVEERQEVWARLLADGTYAVGLFNRSRWPAPVFVDWRDLQLAGPQPVRNLWLRTDEGVFEDGYSSTVQGHGAVMLKIGRPRAD